MRKIRKLGVWSALMCMIGCISAGMTAWEQKAVCAQTNEGLNDTPKTYGLYTSQTLADATGGKVFSGVKKDEALIYCMDGNGDGVTTDSTRKAAHGSDSKLYYATSTDTAYAYNAANIGNTPSGTNVYQTYGYSEVFFEAYPGGVQRGGEWLLADTVDTKDYGAISVDIGYKSPNPLNGDTEGESVIYVYGVDKDGEKVVVSKKVPFGVNYWTTGIVEFSEEMVSVSRIAVSVLWGTVSNQGVSGSPAYVYLRGFTVHTRLPEQDVVRYSPNQMSLDFYNGNSMCGVFGSNQSMRVFHSNTGYAATFGITGGNYAYGTQRMSVGGYITLQLKDPVNVKQYKYLDIDLKTVAQIAEGEKWLAETATKFYIKVLKFNSTSTETDAIFEIPRQTWETCRVDLTDFADSDGYVKKLVFYYSGNDAGRELTEEGKYSIQLGVNTVCLTNLDRMEQTQALMYFVEKPQIDGENITFRVKTSTQFSDDQVIDEAFYEGIFINGQTLQTLMAENHCSVTFEGAYITLSVSKNVFRLDDTDTLEIIGNLPISEGLTTKEYEKFVYYHSLNRFELTSDENAKKTTQIGLELVEMGTVNDSNTMYDNVDVIENTIFVTFSYAICYNGNASHMQLAMEEMGRYSGANDDYVYELAKNGVIVSCMDLLYVNGKSIREWMQLDYAEGKEGLIRVSFMGEWNWGKVLRVMAAENSNLKIGPNKDMSIEFKKGFVTPVGKFVDKDIYACISAENALGVNSVFDIVDKTQYPVVEPTKAETPSKGCASVIAAWPVGCISLAAVALCLRKRKGDKRA